MKGDLNRSRWAEVGSERHSSIGKGQATDWKVNGVPSCGTVWPAAHGAPRGMGKYTTVWGPSAGRWRERGRGDSSVVPTAAGTGCTFPEDRQSCRCPQ